MQAGVSRAHTGAPAAHIDTLACGCRPEIRKALGGGHIWVHRTPGLSEGRETPVIRSPDRLCGCGAWHLTGHPHLGQEMP